MDGRKRGWFAVEKVEKSGNSANDVDFGGCSVLIGGEQQRVRLSPVCGLAPVSRGFLALITLADVFHSGDCNMQNSDI